MRIFADGVFDFYHRGHREHFQRLKNIEGGVELIVGVISDEVTFMKLRMISSE
tara:strand:- start:2509 stop:2667 length:159 start_codon:yes stop_codon:yes gene_type:complete